MAYTWTTGETITAEKLNATDGLPSVTSSDNGKVLSVVNGAWAAALYPNYDAVITLDSANDNGPELIYGNFSSTLNKLNNGVPIFGFCWAFDTGLGVSKNIKMIEIDGEDIALTIEMGENDTWLLIWHDDDTVEWD